MYKVTKEFKFEAAHRVIGAYAHECADTIHGHSYRVLFEFTSPTLDDNGVVVDFKKVSEIITPFIDQFDHALVLWYKDPNYSNSVPGNLKLVSFSYNPTAENMAKYFYNMVETESDLPISRVIVYETSTAYAEYTK